MPAGREPEKLSLNLDDVVRSHVLYVLEINGNNLSKTARDLGIYRSTLKRKIRKWVGF